MIVVTHEMSFAQEVADRVEFLDQGVVIQSGPFRELITNPATPKVAAFMRHLS